MVRMARTPQRRALARPGLGRGKAAHALHDGEADARWAAFTWKSQPIFGPGREAPQARCMHVRGLMQIPLQITFHEMDPSDAIDAAIRKHVSKLERFHDRITRCHVTIDVPHRRHRNGRLYAVRIAITTPTGEIAVTRDPDADHSHEEMSVVIRDAFDAATRQLEDEARRARGDVKTHAAD